MTRKQREMMFRRAVMKYLCKPNGPYTQTEIASYLKLSPQVLFNDKLRQKKDK